MRRAASNRLGTAALAVGLALSVGATTDKCSADPDVNKAQAGGKHATGSVVRCSTDLSCDVILRRATTRDYAGRLKGGPASDVAAAATAELACLLLTERLSTHIVCALGVNFAASKLIEALHSAAGKGECLRVHLQVPGVHGTWNPVAYQSYDGSGCAA